MLLFRESPEDRRLDSSSQLYDRQNTVANERTATLKRLSSESEWLSSRHDVDGSNLADGRQILDD